MKNFFKRGLALVFILLLPAIACAQTSPGLYTGQVPTAQQWNSYFAAKQDWPPPVFSLTVNGAVPFPTTATGRCLTDNTTWQTCGGGGGGTPGGSTTQLQYNNAGSFGGVPGFTWNGTILTLPNTALGTPASGNGTNLTSLTAANLVGSLPAISGAALTSLTAANLTGALPAISGANLTSLTAANLSGAVPVNKGGTACTAAALSCLTAITGATGTPSGTTFLRGDNQWATPAGSGNVTGPGSAVSGNVTSFSGTSGTIIQDAGIASSALATLTGSQTLTNKTITAPIMTAPVLGTPASGTLTNATGLVPSTGLAATGTPSASTFLRGDNTWQTVSGTGTVTSVGLGAGLCSSTTNPITTTGTISWCTTNNAQTGTSYATVAGDGGKIVSLSNASAVGVSLSQATTTGFTAGFGLDYANINAGQVTITAATSIFDNGLTTLLVAKGQDASVWSDGTNYHSALSMPLVVNNGVLANISGATNYPVSMTLTSLWDSALCSTQGSVLYRGASVWSCLAPGTSGQLLSSGGPAANPSWATATGTGTVTTLTAGSGVLFSSGATCTATCTISTTVSTNAQTGTSYATLTTDGGKIVSLNNASAVAVSLSQASTAGFVTGFGVEYANIGAGAVTVTAATSTFGNGLTTLVLNKGQYAFVASNSTNYPITAVTLPVMATNTYLGNTSGTSNYPTAQTFGTGVATALGTAVSGTGSICLSSGSSCSGGGSQVTPSYIANNYYSFNAMSASGSSTVSDSVTTRWYPVTITKALTISQLCSTVTTAVAGNMQFAIATNNASTSLPSTILNSTASISTAATGPICGTLASSVSITTPGVYWVGYQVDNVTARSLAVSNVWAGAQYLAGAATLANFMNTTGSLSQLGWVQTSTFGTWNTTSIVETAMGGTATMPMVFFKVASVP